jgi:lipoprotein NlpI
MRSIVAAVLAALLVGAARGETVDDYAKQCLAALKAGEADKALELAEKAMALDPKSGQALFVRGLAHSALHKSADAVADFDKVLEVDPKRVEAYDRRGSEQFKLDRFAESVADFDRFLEAKPGEAPGHWRRGISLYYAGRYDDGRKQFAAYEKVDTNDVENAVWHFLCAARADGVEKARANMLKIGKDQRVPMMQVYALFHGDIKPADVLAAAEDTELKLAQRQMALFYAHLYLGLYHEANGDKKKALEHLELAADKYRTDGYMGDVARVHRDLLRKEK